MAPNKPFNKFNKQNKPQNNNKAHKQAPQQQKKVVQNKPKVESEWQDEVDPDVEVKQQQQKQQKSVSKVGQKIQKQKNDKKPQAQKKQGKVQPNSNQAKDGKKNEKKQEQKQKKQEVVEESSDDDSSDIEVENEEYLNENMDNQNELLGNLAQMKKTNTKKDKKEKERKITEFKFRVLDMLEIFIKKTKSPQIFIQSLSQIFQCVKDNCNDRDKQTFVEKICQIVKKFFERHVKMLPEYRDNIDECFVEVVKVLAKQPKKSINSALTFAAISLFKIRIQMNLGDNEVLLQALEKALEKSALKKEISYTEEFYKELIRNSQQIAFKLLNNLLQYALLNKDGGAKERNKQFILSLLNYTIRNTAVQELIKKQPTDTVNALIKLTSVFSQQEEIKKKKIGVLNKYVEIFSQFATILKESKIPQKEELLNKVKESVGKWPETDHNLKNIQKKLLEKFTL